MKRKIHYATSTLFVEIQSRSLDSAALMLLGDFFFQLLIFKIFLLIFQNGILYLLRIT